MKILLTNDDGIESEGICKFAAFLEDKGHEIYILAPDGNRSGMSSAITIVSAPLIIEKRGPRAWCCSGQPADCVIVALKVLPVKPDLVVSGINSGANMGTDVLYSGTVGAARQAALYGIPAVALSLVGRQPFPWDRAVAYAAEHLEEYAAFWKPGILVNVNIPYDARPEGTLITFPGVRIYSNDATFYEAPDGRTYCFVKLDGDASSEALTPIRQAAREPGSDLDAASRNLVSISPVYIHPVVRQDLCPGAGAGVSFR
jgi:5'-nucleotidase